MIQVDCHRKYINHLSYNLFYTTLYLCKELSYFVLEGFNIRFDNDRVWQHKYLFQMVAVKMKVTQSKTWS